MITINNVFSYLTLVVIIVYSVLLNQNYNDIILIKLTLPIFFLIVIGYTLEKIVSKEFKFFTPFNLVLLGLFIVHIQIYIDLVIGNIDTGVDFVWVDKNNIVKVYLINQIGILAFIFSYNYFNHFRLPLIFFGKYSISRTWFLDLISIISCVSFFYFVNPLYLIGFYGVEDMGTIATYSHLIFILSWYAKIIQNYVNKSSINQRSFTSYIKSFGIIQILFLIIFLVGVVSSGDRGPLISLLISFCIPYILNRSIKINVFLASFLIFISLFSVSLLGSIRKLDNNLGLLLRIQESFGNNSLDSKQWTSFLPYTQEMALSLRTVNHAVSYVPKYHPYLYGRFQLTYILTSVPFTYNMFPLLFNDLTTKYSSSASFVTWINQGDNPHSGDGTSTIADFYLDFGYLGVLIGMLLWGGIISYTEKIMFASTPIRIFALCFAFVYFSQGFYIARASVFFELKNVFWVFLLLKLNNFITKFVIK